MVRSRRVRVLQAATGPAVLLALCACTGPAVVGSPPSAAAPVTSPVVPPVSTPSSSPSRPADSPVIIGFGSIGDVTTGMTAEQIGSRLDAVTERQDVGPGCSTAVYGSSASHPRAALIAALSVLAESEGAAGRVDVLEIGVLTGPTALQGELLPRTDSGIGLGSTLPEVREAYGDDLAEQQGAYDEQSVEASVAGPDSTAIVFHVDGDGAVTGISTGREPQVRYVEHCL